MDNSRAHTLRIAALAVAWTFSLICMGIGSFEMGADSDPTQRAWLSWGIFLALVAEVPTGWCIVSWYAKRERARVEDIATIAATEALNAQDTHGGGTVVTLR